MDSSDVRGGHFWRYFAGIGFIVVFSAASYAVMRVLAESVAGDMMPEFPQVMALGIAVQVLLSGVFNHSIYVLTALNTSGGAPRERGGMSPDFKVTAGLVSCGDSTPDL